MGNIGDRTADIRHDVGQTVTDLFNENFSAKFTALAKKYNTRFRTQYYGSPPAGLLSTVLSICPRARAAECQLAQFPLDALCGFRPHLMGQRLASSETFTWLHDAPFRAVPVDMKGEADSHFLDGINQIDCHGWPYTPNGFAYPGTSFYAAAVFNDKNPWYVGHAAGHRLHAACTAR